MGSKKQSLCLSLTYKIFSPRGALEAGRRAPVKTTVSALDGALILLRNASVLSVAPKNFDEVQKKQDQSCILAQIFLSCENLRLEFSGELLFITGRHRAVKYRASKCRAECALSSQKKFSASKE